MSTYTDMMERYGKRKRKDDEPQSTSPSSSGNSYYDSVMAKYGKRSTSENEENTGGWQYGKSSIKLTDETEPTTTQRKPIEGWQRPGTAYYTTAKPDIGNAPIEDPESYYANSADKAAALRTIRSSPGLSSWSPAQTSNSDASKDQNGRTVVSFTGGHQLQPGETLYVGTNPPTGNNDARKEYLPGDYKYAGRYDVRPKNVFPAGLTVGDIAEGYGNAAKWASGRASILATPPAETSTHDRVYAQKQDEKRQKKAQKLAPLRSYLGISEKRKENLTAEDVQRAQEFFGMVGIQPVKVSSPTGIASRKMYTTSPQLRAIFLHAMGYENKDKVPEQAIAYADNAMRRFVDIANGDLDKIDKFSVGAFIRNSVVSGVQLAGELSGSFLNFLEQHGIDTVRDVAEFVLPQVMQHVSDEQWEKFKNGLPMHKLYTDNRKNMRIVQADTNYNLSHIRNDTARYVAGKGHEYISAAIPALVMLLEAWMVGGMTGAGGVAGGTTAELSSYAAQQVNPSLLRQISMSAKQLVSNPQFKMTFANEFGTSYQNAIEDGAAEDQAIAYALLNGAFNAAIEIGIAGDSGMQGLIGKGDTTLLDLAMSGLEEAREEIDQGVVERALQNLTYNKGNKFASVTDRDAIFNPITHAEEGAGGLFVSLLLSPSMKIINNAVQHTQYEQAGQWMAQNLSGDERQMLASEIVSEIIAIDRIGDTAFANKIRKKIENGEMITDAELGRLYADYNVSARRASLLSGPQQPTSQQTPQQNVSVPVMQAIDQVMDGERVTNRVADSILQDEEAVAYMQSETGLEITDGMSNSQKREAVRTAVNSLVGALDITAQENGAQPQQEAVTPAQQVADIGQTLNLGDEGRAALMDLYDGTSDPAAYAQAMTVVYNDAVAVTRGEERNQAAVDAAYNSLTEEQREAAYRAGIADAQTQLQATPTATEERTAKPVATDRTSAFGDIRFEDAPRNVAWAIDAVEDYNNGDMSERERNRMLNDILSDEDAIDYLREQAQEQMQAYDDAADIKKRGDRRAAQREALWDAIQYLDEHGESLYDNGTTNKGTEVTNNGQGDTGNGQGSVRGERNDAARQGEEMAGGAAATGGVNDQGGVAEAAGGGRKGDAWSPRRGKTPEARNLVYGREVTDSELGVKTDPSAPKVRAVTSGETSAMKRANATMQRIGKLIGGKVRSLFFGGSDLSIVEDDGSVSRNVEAFSQAWRNFVALPADHPGITVDRFAGHEGMEELLSHGAVKLNEVVDAVRDIIGNDVFDEAVGVYRSIYHSDDTAHWTKEFICDGAGNINRQTAYVDVSDSPLLQARAQLLDVVLDAIHTHLNDITGGAFSDVPPLESQMTDETDVPFVTEETQQTFEDVGAQIDTENEAVTPTDGATQYSERTWNLSDYVQKRNEAAEKIAEILGVSVKTAKKYINDINSVAKMIADDRVRLDYVEAKGQSAVVGNVEYGGSGEFSTLCTKRRLFTGTYEAIQNAVPNGVLTAEDVIEIRAMMAELGYEVPCSMCYVEGSRMKMGEYGSKFLDLYKKYYPDAAWTPNMYDITTPDGAEKMRTEHPEVYAEYERFWNNHGRLREGDPNLFSTQNKPKLYQAATAYDGELLKLFRDAATVNEKNKSGGFRMQSFSDFEIIHMIDFMHMVMDMSRVGLAGQAYTKVPAFAWAAGMTNIKVNLSLVAKGVDDNGHLILDEVNGMKRTDAEELRNAFSKNVGTIVCVFTDEQIKAAMADPFIDFIIPFHRSQLRKKDYQALGIPKGVKDYTYQQNEKLIKKTYHEYRGRMVEDKAKNFMPNEYWDFSKTGKENAENYLKLCAENNKRPKFYKLLVDNGDGSYSLQSDGSTDGYWKLLIDFKMYDNNGKGSPQMPVVPKFDMNRVTQLLNDYTGGHETFPVAQDVVDAFLKDYKKRHQNAPDIRRSVAPPATERTVDSVLARKLEQARKRADYWRKQTKSNTKALTNIAKDAVTTYNSNVKVADLLPRLRSLVQNMMRSKGTDEDFVAIQEEARDIARDIINGAAVLQGDQQDYFADIRSRLQDTQIFLSRADADSIENYADFRRHLPRYFHITTETRKSAADFFGLNGKKSGVTTNVGTVYDGLRADFPWLFPELSSAGEQLQQIASVMKSIEPIYVNPYSETMAEAITWCANDIINAVTRDDITPTVADRQDAKLSAEKQRGKEALAALRQASQKNLDDALTAEREKQQKRLEELRADRDKKLADLKQHYRDIADTKRQRRMTSEIGTRLLKIMRRLKAMKMSTANAAVRDELIGEFDLVAKSLTNGKAEDLNRLRGWYDEQKKNNPDFISNPYVEDAISRLSQKHISDLSVEEMIELTNVLLNFEHNIREGNRFINSVLGMETYAAGVQTIRDIENSKGSKGGWWFRLQTLNRLNPEPAVHLFTGYAENDPLYVATQELGKGGVKQLDYQRRAYDIFNRFLDDTEFMDSISGKKAKWETITVRQVDGSEVTINLTPAMRISLYLSSLNDNNLRHIRDGGVTIPDQTLYRKGKLSEAMAHGTRVKLEPSTVRQIASGMTEKERAFARAAYRYFNEFSSPEISAVSEAKDGFARPMVDNYFPIDTNRNFLKKEFDAIKRDGSMDGVGWLQERVAGANNPIYLYDADYVVKKAIDAHSKYVGYAIPVQNFGKLWGITTGYWTDDGKYESYVDSVQDAMQKKWGKDAIDYVENMMEAISFTGMAPDSIGSVLRKARSAYAGAVLTFSPGTALMQTTSYPTAAYILGAKPLMKALTQSNKKVDLSLIQKYTPLLWYRSRGYIDPDFGDLTRSGKTGSWATNMIQAMDVATTTKLWTASEYYVQEHNKDLTVGTDAYYKEVADVYNRVIRETQPNYTPMERPQVLKSKNDLTRSLVMFATQRFQNFNILYDALGKMQAEKTRWKNTGDESAQQAYKEASQAASRAIFSQLAASFAFALVTALRDFLRGKTRKYKDKDDEYTFWSVAGGLGRNMLANGFGMFILGSEAATIAEGFINSLAKGFRGENLLDTNFYGFEVSVLENLTNIVNDSFKLAEHLGAAASALANGEDVGVESLLRTAAKAAGDVGSITGTPIANIRRVLEVVGRLGLKGIGLATGNRQLFDYYALRITSDPDKSKTDYYDLLWQAYKSGSKDYDDLYDLMLKDGFTEKGIKNAMEKKMKQEQGVKSVKDLSHRYQAP